MRKGKGVTCDEIADFLVLNAILRKGQQKREKRKKLPRAKKRKAGYTSSRAVK